ncbi:MAG: plasmid pRiA4b ORF-3 family protein [Clostridiales bacterium]|nr:plasmid pRiA4b ORF-3 family protein [Clostridiales bacterium]
MNKSCEAASYYKFYIYDNKISDKKYSSDAYINHPAYNRESLRPIILLVCNEGTFDYPQEIEAKLDSNVKLSHYIPRFKKMKYIYDFGDEWQHYIVVEKIVEGYDKNYPVCIGGAGDTPPEDVGGEPGYEKFLEAIADDENPEHENMVNWGKAKGTEISILSL